MILITWNVQWCRGIDEKVDPARIAHVARELADFDVLCLQEVAINFSGLGGSRGEDQMAELAASLPGYVPLFGPGTDLDGGSGRRRQFGNAVFTRLPVLQVFRHLLPWPPDETVPSMQRAALEVVVESGERPLRVITTHLEYYSRQQRAAQSEHLLHLHAEACAHARGSRPTKAAGSPFDVVARPASAILCGDFNFKSSAPEYAQITASPREADVPQFVDAWTLKHADQPHPPTFLVHDPSASAYGCDFVFVTDDLAASVRSIEVNGDVDASDHQPVIVELQI